jgi:hypothetical protein
MKAAALDGHKVLLLMIERSVIDETGLAAGPGRWNGEHLEVTLPGRPQAIQVRPIDVEHGGFSPDRLKDVVSTKTIMHVVEECAEGVSWCVPMFVTDMPKQAEILTCIFAGLASRADGVVLIMTPPQHPNGAS